MLIRIATIVLIASRTFQAEAAPKYLKGIVVDGSTGKPVVSATVSVPAAGREFGTSDSDGVFQVPLSDSLAPGALLTIVVQKSGFETIRKTHPFSPDDVVRFQLSPVPRSSVLANRKSTRAEFVSSRPLNERMIRRVLELALQAARSVDSAGERDLFLQQIASAQVEIGDISAAIGTTQAIQDWMVRDQSLRSILIVQAKIDTAAGKAFTEILNSAEQITNISDRIEVLSEIASTQARAEKWPASQATFARALAHARSIDNPYLRARALNTIATWQAKAGDSNSRVTLDEAVQIARTQEYKALVDRMAADDASKGGNRVASVWTLIAVERDQALSAVATGQSILDLDAALKIVDQIEPGYSRDSAIKSIMLKQVEIGNVQVAFATATRITEPSERVDSLIEATYMLSRSGDPSDAALFLQSAASAAAAVSTKDFGVHRFWALHKVAVRQIEIGQAKAATVTLREAQNMSGTSLLWLKEVAEAQVKAGDIAASKVTTAQALSVLRRDKITTASDLDNLCDLALIQARLGENADALATVRHGIRSFNRIKKEWGADQASLKIALTFAYLGVATEAVALARTLKDPQDRRSALRQVVKVMTKRGQDAEALLQVRPDDNYTRDLMQHDIAVAQAECLNANAINTARGIQDSRLRSSAYHEIATAFAAAGDVNLAHTSAGFLDGPELSTVLTEIALTEYKRGQIAQSQATIEQAMTNAGTDGRSLQDVVRALPVILGISLSN